MSDAQAIGPKPLPPELDRWNWGAFLLNWIWGIGNNTYLALLSLVPVFGLAMFFVLGARGNRWAWQNGRWTSIEHFKRVQRGWATWGLAVWLIAGLLIAVQVGENLYFAIQVRGLVFQQIDNSDVYKLGVAQLQASPVATATLGTPIAMATTHGKVSMHTSESSDGNGAASITFPASGPKASGTVAAEATRKDSVWTLTRLTLKPDGSDREIDLIAAAENKS
jgi:hypothetical protein